MKALLLVASGLLVPWGTAAQDSLPPVKSLERPGDGSPVCGLGREFHAGRRALLRQELEKGLVLVRGMPDPRGYTKFHQDKVFWYLTGVASPGVTLLMDAESGREILFLPEPSPGKEVWNGEMWDSGDEWVRELTGFSDVRPAAELMDVLGELCAEQKTVWISGHPAVVQMEGYDMAGPHDRRQARDPLDGRPSREDALEKQLEERFGVRTRGFERRLHEMRRVKTPEEIAALRRAGRAGALAMVEAMRSTRPGIGEWDLDGLMTWVQMREGASGPAYHAIVGAGANSLVLHYSASSRTLRDGEVVLIDYGCEVDHYTTDITRTWPVNGRFTERQAELYDAVLAAQAAGIAAAKPGNTIGDVDAAATAVLRERGLRGLIRHSTCHMIGLEVHDVGSTRSPLVPGVAFTIEPGVYEEATGIGIRIEDVVVITADGCEVVTGDVPKARAEVEALVQSEGVLDWLIEKGR